MGCPRVHSLLDSFSFQLFCAFVTLLSHRGGVNPAIQSGSFPLFQTEESTAVFAANNWFRDHHCKPSQISRGKKKAVVATARAVLATVWHVLSTATPYREPSHPEMERREVGKKVLHHLRNLRRLGVDIRANPDII